MFDPYDLFICNNPPSNIANTNLYTGGGSYAFSIPYQFHTSPRGIESSVIPMLILLLKRIKKKAKKKKKKLFLLWEVAVKTTPVLDFPIIYSHSGVACAAGIASVDF